VSAAGGLAAINDRPSVAECVLNADAGAGIECPPEPGAPQCVNGEDVLDETKVCAPCGDGVCQGADGENSCNCPQDCSAIDAGNPSVDAGSPIVDAGQSDSGYVGVHETDSGDAGLVLLRTHDVLR
jgi:hypothetical protein